MKCNKRSVSISNWLLIFDEVSLQVEGHFMPIVKRFCLRMEASKRIFGVPIGTLIRNT